MSAGDSNGPDELDSDGNAETDTLENGSVVTRLGRSVTRRLRRVIIGVLGFDIVLRLGPEALDTVVTSVLGLGRVFEPLITESIIIVFGLVVRYPDFVWTLGWLAITLIAVRYVPELVRPDASDWPSGVILRLLFAIPVVWSGLLAEAAIRRLIEQTIGPVSGPFVAPLTAPVVGGDLLVTAALFGAVYWHSDDTDPPRKRGAVGYLLQAYVLVTVLGVSFAAFSLLSPYSELFAITLYFLPTLDQKMGDTDELGEFFQSFFEFFGPILGGFFGLLAVFVPIPTLMRGGDPAERLTTAVTTVWERPAQTVMALYVTSALTVVLLTLIAVRIRAPPNMLAVAPVSTLYLLLVAGGATLYSFVYSERTLRQFRRNFNPEMEPTTRVEGQFLPAAVLVSILLNSYVFGTPLARPDLVHIVVGAFTVWIALVLISERDVPGFAGEPTSDALQSEGKRAGVSFTKEAAAVDDGEAVGVEFEFESEREEATEIEVTETLPYWARPGDYWLGEDGSGEWDRLDTALRYEVELPPDATRTARYRLGLPESAQVDEVMRGFNLRISGAWTSRPGNYEFNVPMYHLPPAAIALFAAILGAVAPFEGQYIVTTLLDGTVSSLDYDSVAWRFVRIFLLVVLPYVPFGVATHRRQLAEMRQQLDGDSGGFELEQGEALEWLSSWGVIVAVGFLATVDKSPILPPAFDPWVPLLLAGVGVCVILLAGVGETVALLLRGLSFIRSAIVKSVNRSRRDLIRGAVIALVTISVLLLLLETTFTALGIEAIWYILAAIILLLVARETRRGAVLLAIFSLGAAYVLPTAFDVLFTAISGLQISWLVFWGVVLLLGRLILSHM